MTSPLETRPAGAVQVGEVVNAKRVVGVQNTDGVTVLYEDGTQDTFAFTDQIPFQ